MNYIARNKNFFFATIIGAGPAGLCCAYELTKNKIGPILIVEKGCNVNRRNHKISLSHYTEGVGGPGLYGDAKLCVYGRAGTKLTKFFSENFLNQLANYVDKIFRKFDKNNIRKESPSKSKIKKLQKICKDFDFRLKMAYPVRHLGFQKGGIVVEELVNWLKQNGVFIKTETQAVKIIKKQEGYKIILKDRNFKKIVECKYLVVAVGRSGNQWLKKQCETLQIPFSSNTPDIGIRIECPKNVLKPIYVLARNPRIELPMKNSYIKTHCLCMGGEIIIYLINSNLFIDGHAGHEGKSAHINLLYHSDENKKLFNLKIKKPIIQRMGDFMKDEASGKEKIVKNKLVPSAPVILLDCDKDINDIFPAKMTLSMKKVINHFNKLCPGFNDNDNLIYAPVIEWNTYQIVINKEMETKQKNFYVVGDGSGLTQGIIAAGVTGIIAARSILSKEKGHLKIDARLK